jgi:glutamate-1-semialdehyde 2,1-aminomutase
MGERTSPTVEAVAAERKFDFTRSNELRPRAHRAIPGGAHTYSKGDDQFPQESPGFIRRAKGCFAWDVDGNCFLDWGMGLRTSILGHAYPRIIEAVATELPNGCNFTRPSPLELELAERFIGLIPSAEMVKFAKNGSDVTTAAVRLARAYTGRDLVARCRESQFHSFDDWFIGTTPCDTGIPKVVSDLTLTFPYNDIAGLQALFERHPNEIATVILEPVYYDPPAPGYLAALRDLTHRHGAVLIFDEIISGFRWDVRGAQHYFGVTPDLACFGKTVANGFSLSVLVGRRDIMEMGGLAPGRERVFLLSCTHGAETHSLAASLATIDEIVRRDVVPHLWRVGEALQTGFNALAKEMGLDGAMSMDGYPCSPMVTCRDASGQPVAPFRTLFLQEMVAGGVLIPYIAPSLAHGQREVEMTLDAARRAFQVYAKAVSAGSVAGLLVGPEVKPVFRRYN